MQNSSVKSKNWLLVVLRKWHGYAGIAAGLLILVAGASGIVLNYKKPIFTALGLERGPDKPSKTPRKQPAVFSTSSGLNAAAVKLDQALEVAHKQWGDVPLDRIEVKAEHGALTYRIRRQNGVELFVDALTGHHFIKERYSKPSATTAGGLATDWGRLLLDLHTGKIGGEAGKAVMTFAAVMLLFLTGSGVYLWCKPLLIRRQNTKSKAAPTENDLRRPVTPSRSLVVTQSAVTRHR